MQPYASDVAGPPVNSREFWQKPFREPASSDPDQATAQTIGIMCGHIKNGASDQLVQQTAGAAAQQFSGIGGLHGAVDESSALAGAAWWYCKLFVKFVHHEFIIRQKLGEAGHLQGLISPEVLVRMDSPEGDCAIFSECVCSFLRVFGIPYELVTVAVNPEEPEIFSHVYVYAVLKDGSRLPLDASHGKYPGWQVPSSDVYRRQVWDEDGNPVADQGSRFDGLHNYGLRGGLGADGDWAGEYTGTDYVNPTAIYGTDIGYQGDWSVIPSGAPSGSIPVPPQTASQWPAVAAQLAKMGFTIAQMNALKPGMVIKPDGTVLQQTPGYSVPIGTQISSALGGGNTLLYLGIGAAVLIGISMMGKR